MRKLICPTYKSIIIYFLFIALVLILGFRHIYCEFSADENTLTLSDTVFMMDTVVTITLYSDNPELLEHCLEECKRYELIFSRTDSRSELYRLNHSKSMQVSDDLLAVLKASLYYCEVSDGRFDITMGNISDMYSFSQTNPRLPEESALKEALSHVDYKSISINGNTVTRNDTDNQIDLGAAAKGYIADKLGELILQSGEKSAIIDLGGNIFCVGSKPDGSDYNIGIQYPFKNRSETIANVHVSQKSVVTSGIYERSFEQDGQLYHHILNPSTGLPYENSLLAVSIISDSSLDGDILSTVCFTLGLTKGLELINSTKGAEAVFVTKDYKLHFSKEFPAFIKK